MAGAAGLAILNAPAACDGGGSRSDDSAPAGASDANVTAYFCPYNAATSCMAEGMECPNSTSNPATHETWSEECLEECAAILAVKMDLSDMDTDLGPLDDPVNVPILTEGGVDFEPPLSPRTWRKNSG